MLETLLPPRERYPPETGGSPLRESRIVTSSELHLSGRQSLAAPLSARVSSAHHHIEGHGTPAVSSARGPAEKRSARVPPNRLQSLDEFIASEGPTVSAGMRPLVSEKSEAPQLREIVNKLLGLDKDATLNEETTGGRHVRLNVRWKKVEKKLDEVQDGGLMKNFASENLGSMLRRIRKEWDAWEESGLGEAMDAEKFAYMSQLAAIERYCKDLSASSEDQGAMETDRVGTGKIQGSELAERQGGSEWNVEGGPGAADQSSASLDRRRRRIDRLEADEAAKHVAKFKAVARLRAALVAYQTSREERRERLQEKLSAMNHPISIRRRKSKLSLGTPRRTSTEDQSQYQHAWYRDLLCRLQDNKLNLPRVAHYVFDCVKQVLDCHEEFGHDLYFAMLEQIEDCEYTRVIAGLVVNMIGGISNVTTQDLVLWFEQHRGAVPPAVAELLEEHSDEDKHEAAGPHTVGVERNSRGITFITDAS